MRDYIKVKTGDLREIRRLNGEGKNDVEISRETGIPCHTVKRHRKEMGLPIRRKNSKAVNYTVYDAKTDELLAFGTSDMCAELLGFKSVSRFYEMVSRVEHGRVKKYNVLKEENREE